MISSMYSFLRALLSDRPPSLALQSLLAGLLIVVAAFPDVVFITRSISMSDTYSSTISSHPPKPMLPEAKHRAPYHGFTDTGGAVWQSEPMIQFMRSTILSGDSPYWNPYSATGALGPETMVDQKFSPLTVLTALGGGGNRAFHAVVLGSYVLAVAFFFGALRRFLSVGALAAAGGAVVYLLNGFHVANLNSNVVQVYLYMPACLFALLAFSERPSALRFLGVFLAHVPVFMTTFMPTTIMALIGTYGIAFAYACGQSHGQPMAARARRGAAVLGLQGAAGLLALALLAPIYMPIIESFSTIGTVDAYNQRVFYPVTINNLIGAFTPKHLFESYNAIDPSVWDPNKGGYIGNVAFHMGLVAMVLVACAVGARHGNMLTRYVAVGAGLLLAVVFGRLYAVPGFALVIEALPLIRSIGAQYWWMMAGVLVPVLAGLGLDAVVRGTHRKQAAAVVALVVLIALAALASSYSPVPKLRYVILCLLVIAGVLLVSVRMVARAASPEAGRRVLAACVLVLVAYGEYMFYMNHLRYVRIERVLTPPPEVAVLRERIGQGRFANFGYAGLPPEWGSMYLLPQVESLNMNVLPHYLSFFQRNFLADKSTRWGEFPTFHHAKDVADFNFEALDLLGVRYMMIPTSAMPKRLASLDPKAYPRRFESPAVTVVENPSALPRGFLVPELQRAPGAPHERGLWGRNIAFTEDATLVKLAAEAGIPVDRADAGKRGKQAGPAIPDAAAQVAFPGNAQVTARLTTERPAVFVLSDAWYPNWKAYANGRELHVGRVNEAFRGVVVPAGVTELEMRYAPRSLPLAKATSLGALLLAGLVLLLRRRLDKGLIRLAV